MGTRPGVAVKRRLTGTRLLAPLFADDSPGLVPANSPSGGLLIMGNGPAAAVSAGLGTTAKSSLPPGRPSTCPAHLIAPRYHNAGGSR